MAIQASFAEELSGLHDSDHGFLALLGDNENLDLSLLDIENSICGVPAFFSKFNMVVPSPTLARKRFGSNKLFAAFDMRPLAPGVDLGLAGPAASMLGNSAVLRRRALRMDARDGRFMEGAKLRALQRLPTQQPI
jgi:hypothetical protein